MDNGPPTTGADGRPAGVLGRLFAVMRLVEDSILVGVLGGLLVAWVVGHQLKARR